MNYVASATYPLIEFFTALASVLPTTTSPAVDSCTLLNLRGGYRFWQQKAAAGYMRDAEVAVSVLQCVERRT